MGLRSNGIGFFGWVLSIIYLAPTFDISRHCLFDLRYQRVRRHHLRCGIVFFLGPGLPRRLLAHHGHSRRIERLSSDVERSMQISRTALSCLLRPKA